MSQVLINKYLTELAKLRQVGGTSRESVVREAFKDLLKAWGRTLDLTFIPEYELETKAKERRYVDGALLHTLRVPFGYWEAKDEKDDLDAEIVTKFRRGYPKSNIIFEDSTEAVLIQHGEEVLRCGVEDVEQLEKLLKRFFAYERPEIEAFRKAVAQFKVDLPAVLEALRSIIDTSYKEEPRFRKAAGEFLKHSRGAINPTLTDADVREMLIQHILTGEVFEAVFPGTNYHEDNSVARELYKLEATFFTGNAKHQTLKGLAPYYTAIRKATAEISTHHEKQTFLKAIYENFYKVYNPKAADRLGVVYTPNEIVRFMISGADWLCEQHFGRSLIDRNVDILDPATGTGTFICELIEHFAGQPEKLRHKYRRELHANEVAILPYYVANLNIEATFAAVTGAYEEFPGLCFVDTLDNTWALRKRAGDQSDLFGSVTDDNIKRIRQQNSRRISVIIGNPPYNANQLNENENNKNREYPEIDKRIRETYVQESGAQKTKLYDMYARFFRWAADRVDENGVLALVTNRSFIDGRTFDGFRAVVTREFNEIRIVDLGGDIRANPKLSGTSHNVFGIQTGVAISFMVKRAKKKGCRLFYYRRPEFELAEEKRSILASQKLSELEFTELQPDAKHNWVNVTSNDFEQLIPIASKSAKKATSAMRAKAIFHLYSLGVSTNRDAWLIDASPAQLKKKLTFFIRHYDGHIGKGEIDNVIKWSETLLKRSRARIQEEFSTDRITDTLYRPFVRLSTYQSPVFVDRLGLASSLFPLGKVNRALCFMTGDRQDFSVIATSVVPNLNMFSADAVQYVAEFRYGDDLVPLENITDWAVEKFARHYRSKAGNRGQKITKGSIFHYVYAVLHDPAFREKYLLNLKREFPRIPLYRDFWQWEAWGQALMKLHVDYDSVSPFPLKRKDVSDQRPESIVAEPKAKLKADKARGRIELDSQTSLTTIPSEAWDYKLGNRSALEWILDQYKEKKPKDPTIREKFNDYRFADYKEKVIDLLSRVTTVSVETVRIVEEMRTAGG